MSLRSLFNIVLASLSRVVSMAFALGNAVGNPAWGLIYDKAGAYAPRVKLSPVIVLISMGIFVAILRLRKSAENK